VVHVGHNRGVYRVLFGRPEGKRPLEKPKRGWEMSIKMVLTRSKMRRHGLNCSGSGKGQVAGSCKSVNELSSFIK
jgi:hypothetical protein